MAFDIAVVAFILALALGGRPRHLARLPWRGLPLVSVLVALLVVGLLLAFVGTRQDIARWVLLLAHGLVAVLLLWNWRVPGMAVVAVGLALNFAVIAANVGFMPVDPQAVARLPARDQALLYAGEKPRHTPLTDETPLAWMADRYVFPVSLLPPYPQPQVFSVGDVVMSLGMVWVLFVGMAVRFRPGCPPCGT